MIQGLAGWMSLTGEADGPPAKSGLSLVDYMAGYVSVLALTAAVWRARRDGVGGDCDISLFETAMAQLSYVGTWAAGEGFVPPRMSESAHLSIVPFQAFPARDGWIVLACPKPKFWQRLCHAIDRPDLLQDPRYSDFAGRSEHRETLVGELREVFRTRPAAEWVDLLQNAGVPVGPVNTVAQALKDPQLHARDGLIAYEHPTLGTVRQLASPLRISDTQPPVRRAPRLGEHTDEVTAQLCDYDPGKVAELREQGAFGQGAADG